MNFYLALALVIAALLAIFAVAISIFEDDWRAGVFVFIGTLVVVGLALAATWLVYALSYGSAS